MYIKMIRNNQSYMLGLELITVFDALASYNILHMEISPQSKCNPPLARYAQYCRLSTHISPSKNIALIRPRAPVTRTSPRPLTFSLRRGMGARSALFLLLLMLLVPRRSSSLLAFTLVFFA